MLTLTSKVLEEQARHRSLGGRRVQERMVMGLGAMKRVRVLSKNLIALIVTRPSLPTSSR